MRLDGHDRTKGDQRIFGDENFVDAVLSLAEEKYSHQQKLLSLGYNFAKLVDKVASIYNIEPDYILKKGRQKQRVAARSLLCFWAVRELGLSLKNVSEQIGMSSPGVSYSVHKGEQIAAERRLHLLERPHSHLSILT